MTVLGKQISIPALDFLDHMLDGFARHGLFDLSVSVKGDLEVDCHHAIEDTGIVLGQAILQSLGEKNGDQKIWKFHAADG